MSMCSWQANHHCKITKMVNYIYLLFHIFEV
uniref:Uncharacterized protein n=1 Tax=Siphoviridae sp. cthL03 TaxID=2825615 RepID=A0A8S5PGV7_9CAUD|nr:MAG TPA: hypothetical protein [Siphoviridae sp. cthL03]